MAQGTGLRPRNLHSGRTNARTGAGLRGLTAVLAGLALLAGPAAIAAPANAANTATAPATTATTTAANTADPVNPDDGIQPAPEHLPQTPTVDITPQVVDLTFPVAKPDHGLWFKDDFLQLRGGGSRLHAATDLMAPKHRAVHAAVGGTITFAPNPEPSYGWMLSIRGDDGHRYSYVHLNNDTPEQVVGEDGKSRWLDDDAGGIEHAYAPRIVAAINDTGTARGLRVERGELIGWLGDSGNAKGVAPHLHFEIEFQGSEATGGPYRINPYHSLKAALAEGDVPDHAAAVPQPEKDWTQHGGTYKDVDPNGTHGRAIEKLAAEGILGGCDGLRFCPTEAMGRADLAVGMAAALGLHVDDSVTARFPDVAWSDPRTHAIAAVDAAGILTGYEDGTFGPDEALSRAQLASVLVRGFEVAPATRSQGFGDVRPGSTHAAAIDALAESGLTRGCGDGSTYCGSEMERRDRVATFLQRGRELGVR